MCIYIYIYTQQKVKCVFVIVHIKLQAENWIQKQNKELREKISKTVFLLAEMKLHFFELLKKKRKKKAIPPSSRATIMHVSRSNYPHP